MTVTGGGGLIHKSVDGTRYVVTDTEFDRVIGCRWWSMV